MTLAQLRAFVDEMIAAAGPAAFVLVNGAEYHLTGKYEVERYREDCSVVAVNLQVDLGGGDDFGTAVDA